MFDRLRWGFHMKVVFCIFCSMIYLSGCQPIIDIRGNDINGDVKKILLGKTTRNDIQTLCGSPTFVFDQDSWMYIGGKVATEGIFEPDCLSQYVYKIYFDKNDVVQKVEKLDRKKIVFDINPDCTDLISNEKSKVVDVSETVK